MRRRIPFIVSVFLFIALGMGYGAGFIYENVFAQKVFEYYDDKTSPTIGEVGSMATDVDLPYLKSIEEIVNHEGNFLIRLEDKNAFTYNDGSGFLGDITLLNIYLPSGEMVAARINTQNIIFQSDDFSENGITFPVASVVYAEIEGATLNQLTANGAFKLDRTDFYLDMFGSSNYGESYTNQMISSIISLAVFLIAFIILRNIGIALGIYPAIFLTKKQRQRLEVQTKSDWE